MATARRRSLSLVHRLRSPASAAEPGAPPPALLLLHGVGANELAMASISEAFDPRFMVISARAPITLAPFSFAWHNVTFTPEGPVIDAQELEAAWSGLTRFIDEAIEAYDVDPARVFLAGFSQGGIVALATLLTAPEKVAGVVCMSGRLPPEVMPHVVAPARLQGKPVLIVHGRNDGTLGVDYGRTASRTLKGLPLAVEYREFEMGHTTTVESLSAVSAWLKNRLAR
jgi:phospholipase/carboxylesterase